MESPGEISLCRTSATPVLGGPGEGGRGYMQLYKGMSAITPPIGCGIQEHPGTMEAENW